MKKNAITLTTQRLATTLVALALAIAIPAYATPSLNQVTNGNATVTQNAGNTTINQTTNNANIDWHSFNVAQNRSCYL